MVVEPRARGKRLSIEDNENCSWAWPGLGPRPEVRASAVTALAAGGEDFPAFGASSPRVTWASGHLGRWTAAWKSECRSLALAPPD